MYWRGPSKPFLLCFAAACLLFTTVHLHSPGRLSAQMATEDRLLYRGWWPRHSVQSAEDYVGPGECAKCHAGKMATQKNTPMALTAAVVADSDILKSRGTLTFQASRINYEIAAASGKSVYTVTDGTHTISAPLTWSFGDGHVGQSYLFERGANLFESRVSYFGNLKALDFTPGRKLAQPKDLDEAMARPVTGSEVVRCFACHSTASTIKEKFDRARMIPGITCEACHGPGLNHVIDKQAEILQGETGKASETIFNPGKLTPLEAVDFCGACHGTYWDVKLQGLAGETNVRAQPYRLEKSRCWGTKGDIRLTCVACHDPHQRLVRDSSSYDKNCLGCHAATASVKATGDHSSGPACKVGTKNCASCHMPKYEIPTMHYAFTDHDIRVVRAGEPYPD